MAVFIENVAHTSVISEFFDFNELTYQPTNLWNNSIDTFGRFILSDEICNGTNNVLILSFFTLQKIINWEISKNTLLTFIKNGNKLWVWDNIDSLVKLSTFHKTFGLHWLDSIAPKNAVYIFLDGYPTAFQKWVDCNNIQLKLMPYSPFFNKIPRIQNAQTLKTNCTKDFLITTICKKSGPHRHILHDELLKRTDLINKGHSYFKSSRNNGWIGKTIHQHTWQDGNPSMDLYLDSWLEIVPETLYKNGYFVTEKTIKPIVTLTPFLALSTCGYLGHLQSLGFKTFNSIIDEKYDQEYRVNDRARLIVDQLEYIISNGAKEFYQECLPILKYNSNRLFEIAGGWQYYNDQFILQNLTELGLVDQ